MNILIIIGLLYLSGASKAVADTLTFWWSSSIFAKYPKTFNPQWWNPVLSHRNKDRAANYFFMLLKQTFFVTFTDAWHTFEMLQAMTLVIAISLVYYYGLDLYGFGGWWNSELLDVATLVVALYAVRMCGNTFTKALIKDKMHIG